MQGKNLLLRLAEQADLPMEPLPGLPVVEIAGDCRVLIENHRGVTEYGRNCIQVKVCYGQVRVYGACLELAKMNGHQLVIRGRIHGVELRKGD